MGMYTVDVFEEEQKQLGSRDMNETEGDPVSLLNKRWIKYNMHSMNPIRIRATHSFLLSTVYNGKL